MFITRQPQLSREDTRRRFLENLGSAQPSSNLDKWLTALTEIISLVDHSPLTIDQLSQAILDTDIWSVHTRIKHNLGSTLLDPEAWGFDWEALDETSQRILNVSIWAWQGFDVDTIAYVLELPSPAKHLQHLHRLGLLEFKSPWLDIYTIPWYVRMLLTPHIEEHLQASSRHAHYLLQRYRHRDPYHLHDFEIEHLEQIIDWGLKHEQDLAARATLIWFHAQHSHIDYRDIIEMLKRVHESRPCMPGDVLGLDILGRLGESYRNTHQFEKSVETLELAVALDPPQDSSLNGGLHMALALSLRDQHQFERAYYMLDKARQAYAHHGSPQKLDAVDQTLATFYLKDSRYSEAIQLFNEVLIRTPTDVITLNNLGVTHMKLGQTRQARHHIEQARMHALQQNTAQNELLSIHNLTVLDIHEDRRDSAKQHIERINVLHQQLGTAHRYRTEGLLNEALYEMRYGMLLQAYHLLSKLLEIDASYQDGIALRGGVMAYLGNLDGAREAIHALRHTLDHPRYPIAHSIAYVEFASRLAKMSFGEDQDTLELKHDVQAFRTGITRCWMNILFDDLEQRIEHLLDDDHILEVHTEFISARTSHTERIVDLKRSAIARSLLRALVKKHHTRPGSLCSIDDLFEAGWPGQIWNTSARTRLHTAIHRLRERLLGDLLLTHGDTGYSLISTCRVKTLHQKSSDSSP